MSYDPFAEHRRRQAEIQNRESQRLWDKTMKDLRTLGEPPPATSPSEGADGLARFLFFLLVPFIWLAGLIWRGDIAAPWGRLRKTGAIVAAIAAILGWTGNALLPAADQGLAWILGALGTTLLVVALAPRTLLVLGVLVAILGIYVEIIAS